MIPPATFSVVPKAIPVFWADSSKLLSSRGIGRVFSSPDDNRNVASCTPSEILNVQGVTPSFAPTPTDAPEGMEVNATFCVAQPTSNDADSTNATCLSKHPRPCIHNPVRLETFPAITICFTNYQSRRSWARDSRYFRCSCFAPPSSAKPVFSRSVQRVPSPAWIMLIFMRGLSVSAKIQRV